MPVTLGEVLVPSGKLVVVDPGLLASWGASWCRVELAIEHGGGAGEVHEGGLWAVAVGELPRDRRLAVVGRPMEGEEFPDRWRWIDIEVEPSLEVVCTEEVGMTLVDHGLLLAADAAALDHAGAETLDALDQARPEALDALTGSLRESLRTSTSRSAMLELGNAVLCGFETTWGDGLFTVFRQLDASGRLVRIRIDAGSENHRSVLRRLLLRAKLAIVSRRVLADGEPVGLVHREETDDPRDSGWRALAGDELEDYLDEPENSGIVTLGELVEREPALEKLVGLPPGSAFERVPGSQGFTPLEPEPEAE